MFSVLSARRLYNATLVIFGSQTRVEAGSNTSTVTLRVVRGDEKGSLKSETVKYVRDSQGTRTRERLRWQGPAVFTSKYRPVLLSERAPDKNKTVTVKGLKKIWLWAPDGARHQELLTDWPSVAMWLWLWLEFRMRNKSGGSTRIEKEVSMWRTDVCIEELIYA
jgi:hypothetical protein